MTRKIRACPPWVSSGVVCAVLGASRAWRVRLLFLLVLAMAGTAVADDVLTARPTKVIPFSFSVSTYRRDRIPEHSQSFLVFENPKKTRPLFITGWGKKDTLQMTFDYKNGLLPTPEVRTAGAGTIEYRDYNFTQAADLGDFALSTVLSQTPPPRITVTVKGFSDCKETTDCMTRYLFPPAVDPGTPPWMLPPPARPVYKTAVDLDLSFQGKTLSLARQPGNLYFATFEVPEGRNMVFGGWVMQFAAECRIKGADLGLSGDDAGELRVTVVGGACAAKSAQPETPVKPDVDKKIETIPGEMKIDL